MEAILNRYRSYRSLVVLVIVVTVQVLYLAYQVKTARDERLIRVWAVSAVTPMAGIVESIRHNTIGFMRDYFLLLDVRDQNRNLKRENDQLRMQNVFYRNQLATADHARALTMFQAKTQSRTVAARVIGDSSVANAKAVFIDRGSTSGVQKGMAVVTPDGIVGKVAAAYPLVAQVLLVTDSTFKVGVESQKRHSHGSLNCGTGHCVVEHIQNEEEIKTGEWFYTSGEDRIFPRGFPVGTVVSSTPGQGMRDVRLNLSGAPGGVEEVLVVLEGVHQPVPVGGTSEETISRSLPPPPPEDKANGVSPSGPAQTEADKLLQKYQQVGKEQNHVYGAMYSNMPDFKAKPPTKEPVADPAQPTLKPPAAASDAPHPPVLGSETKPPARTAPPSAVRKPGATPVLPLGSPRPKPASPPPANRNDTKPPATAQ